MRRVLLPLKLRVKIYSNQLSYRTIVLRTGFEPVFDVIATYHYVYKRYKLPTVPQHLVVTIGIEPTLSITPTVSAWCLNHPAPSQCVVSPRFELGIHKYQSCVITVSPRDKESRHFGEILARFYFHLVFLLCFQVRYILL